MKTFILFILILTIKTIAFTQIQKGEYLLGGSINFESDKDENSVYSTYKSNNFFVSPNIGYFLFDKFASGLRISFSFYDSKSGNVNSHYTSTSISPFLRFYLLPLSKKVNPFVDISYIHNKTKWSRLSDPDYYEKAIGYHIYGGPAIFLTDQIALEFSLGYQHTKSDNFGKTKSNIIKSGLGLQIHLGRNKYSHKKKVFAQARIT